MRREAVTKLSKSSFASKYAGLFETLVGDSSYEVAAAGLKALGEAEPKKALALAKQFENEKNSNLSGAVAEVYAKEGDASYQDFFERKLHSSGGFGKYSLLYHYANFLSRMDKNVVLSGMKTIEDLGASSDSHFITGAAKGALRRIVKSFDQKKEKTVNEIANETSQTAKLELTERLNNCDLIMSTGNDALARLNKKPEKRN